ncbi:MAG: hypothetical protein R3D59_17735 [Paracoccaceae bacterium]
MSAIVSAAGLPPGLALEQGATAALANKETLVTAGPMVLATAEKHRAAGAELLPVDEHSAVFSAGGRRHGGGRRIIITAGGAFPRLADRAAGRATLE